MKLTRIALAALLASTAMSASAEFTFTPFATYKVFDAHINGDQAGASDIERHWGYAGALGYRFASGFGLEANYGRTRTNFITDIPGSENVYDGGFRAERLTLDGYYAFNSSGMFSPYVLLGAGQAKYTAGAYLGNPSESDKETIGNAGLGVLAHINDYIAVRAEARDVYGFQYEDNGVEGLIGVEFSTGRAPAAVAATPEPVVQEKPVEQLAAAPVAPVDSDGDGVPDIQDACASTPAGVQVDSRGCPLDGDKDGVPDYEDKCPNTAEGVVVDSTGCDKVLTEAISKEVHVQFDSAKAVVKDEYKADIGEVAALLKQYPATRVEIQGHTDASGKKAANEKLSQARAQSVADVLVKDFGIDASRVSAKGYGSSQPVADNKTAEGKAKNRRVMAIVSGEAKKVQMKKKK
jgi:OOP family OmpA-OmpF porin